MTGLLNNSLSRLLAVVLLQRLAEQFTAYSGGFQKTGSLRWWLFSENIPLRGKITTDQGVLAPWPFCPWRFTTRLVRTGVKKELTNTEAATWAVAIGAMAA